MEAAVQTLSELVQGRPKEVQYKWMSRNAPGELAYIHKNRLLVDRSYQRDLNDAKRMRIASKFNWAAFGVLLVSRRRNGDLYVIDGQHRLAAAKSRTDVQEVPCDIFDLADNLQDEAFDFLVTNKDRRALSGIESFKAMIATENAQALIVQRLIESVGREVAAAGPKAVACVVQLYRFASTDVASLERIWPTAATICEDQRFDGRLVAGLFTLERKLIDANEQKRSISETKISKHLCEAGYTRLMRSISESSAYYKRGGEVVFARGCLNVLNYKRQQRFALMGVKDGE